MKISQRLKRRLNLKVLKVVKVVRVQVMRQSRRAVMIVNLMSLKSRRIHSISLVYWMTTLIMLEWYKT